VQLVINTFGASLRRKDGLFLVRAGDRKMTVSPKKVSSICLTTGVHLSTDAVRLALEHHIDLVLMDKYGDPYGRFWHGRPGSTATVRRRQLEVASRPEGLHLARQWIVQKLDHQAALLRDLARTRPDRQEQLLALAARLDEKRTAIAAVEAETVGEARGTLMGLEGAAGRDYFAALSLALPERFRFSGRSRSPAADEFNCLLNYTYGMLYGLVERGCLLTGLDPYIGLLHTDNYGKRSLVFDLIELFRSQAERAVVNLFAARKIRSELFDVLTKRGSPPGFRLNAEGRALLIGAMNEHLDRRVLYGRRRLAIRDTITYECQRLAARLLAGEAASDNELQIDLSVYETTASGEPPDGIKILPVDSDAPPHDDESMSC
jgi:CRISPR-associated protein Cas1